MIIDSNGRWIEEFKKEIIKRYGINGIELLHHFLGIEVYQDDEGVFICYKFNKNILKKFEEVIALSMKLFCENKSALTMARDWIFTT